jgi:hypothetical protein
MYLPAVSSSLGGETDDIFLSTLLTVIISGTLTLIRLVCLVTRVGDRNWILFTTAMATVVGHTIKNIPRQGL